MHQASYSCRHTSIHDRAGALDVDPFVFGLGTYHVDLGGQVNDRILLGCRRAHRVGVADISQHFWQAESSRMPLQHGHLVAPVG